MKFIDYYEVLGVTKSATDKEIKNAYRKLARQHHPDLHQGGDRKEAEEKFKKINEAYEVLGDSENRKKYDMLGQNWRGGQEFQPPPGGTSYQTYHMDGMDDFGFSDFFSSIFGQEFSQQRAGNAGRYQTRQPGKQPGEDAEVEISLTIEELMVGLEKEIQISLPTVCSTCEGRRFAGNGICPACGGMGVMEEAKKLKVKIPNKTYPGTVLRLKGLGGKGLRGGLAGDLYLHVQAKSHPKWQVVDQINIEGELFIYPEQAVLGDTVSVATPDGTLEMKIQPGIRSGQKLRLKGRGFKGKDGALGDLYIKVYIDIPGNQTSEEIELYEKISALRHK